jgi:hypothetical protein
MADPILIYDNGNTYYIDSSEIYIPEFEEESTEEDESQDSQSL